MAITSKGFAGGPMTDDDFGAIAARGAWVESTAALAVTQPNTGTRTVAIAAGAAVAHGVRAINDQSINQALAAPGSGGQWYLLTFRRDWTSGVKNTTLQVLTGASTGSTTTPTAPPTSLPATFQTAAGSGQADQPLAWVWVSSASTTLTIFDLRFVLILRGLVALTLFALQTLVLHSPAVLGNQIPCLDGITYRWGGTGTPQWRPWESDWTVGDNFGYEGPSAAPFNRVGRYRYTAGQVLFEGYMTLNTSTMSSDLAIGLPVPADMYQSVTLRGWVLFRNASDSNRPYAGWPIIRDPGAVKLYNIGIPGNTANPGGVNPVNGSIPFNEAWAQSDTVNFSLTYDPA